MRLPRLLIAIAMSVLFTGCVEYRFTRGGLPDQYYGWGVSRKGLDCKLGPKTKIFLTPGGDIRPYVGGSFRRNDLQIGVGVVGYFSRSSSIEIGYRTTIQDITSLDDYNNRIRTIDLLKDAEELFFIGGVIKHD
ncbi:MAG: hypothetical protein V3T23_04650 [Nitrososphaerales archaeon]